MIDIARHVYLAPALAGYAVDLAAATRRLPEVRIGISPRGTVAVVRASLLGASTTRGSGGRSLSARPAPRHAQRAPGTRHPPHRFRRSHPPP